MGVGHERHISGYLRQGSHEAHWAQSKQSKGIGEGVISCGHRQGYSWRDCVLRAVRLSAHFGQVHVFLIYFLLSISDVLANSVYI